ncbi:MAG: tRNA (5-methylaminomethyl-2-thiouridine)(34)-methyltransferase MnmD [Nitratireductor sp.]
MSEHQDTPPGDGPRAPAPSLEWGADGAPRSSAFADAYFDRTDPLGETRYVFLDGCALPERWAGRRRFTIGETGFGTGLNFLAATALWIETQATRPPGARLTYFSVEGFPIRAADLERAHAGGPKALRPLAARLRADWPPPYRGRHLIRWPDHGVTLALSFEPIERALEGLEERADAWFLDGFAPARNPAMWRPATLERLVARSAPGARLASFTAAGAVRRALANAGCTVERRPGFSGKRHCIAALAPSAAPVAAAAATVEASRERPPWAIPIEPAPPSARIAVLGGGPAARWASLRLAQVGLAPVRIGPSVDTPPPRALIAPKLTRGTNAYARISAQAFLHAVRALDSIGADAPEIWRARGAELCEGDQETAAELATTLDWPADWLRCDGRGLSAPRAGVIDPSALHRALDRAASAAGARLLTGEVERLERAEGFWRILAPGGRVLTEAETVVIAAGPDSLALTPDGPAAFSVRYAGGRLFLPQATPDFPDRALSYGGFITGDLGDGQALFGASARNADAPETARAAESDAVADSWRRCIARLKPVRPALAEELAGKAPPSSWVGVRATTPDHLPLFGPVPNRARLHSAFAAYTRGARSSIPTLAAAARTMQPGLLLLTALGARGYQLAPLLADDLAQRLTDAPGALSVADRAAVHPARFAARAMARGEPAASGAQTSG